VAAVKRSESKRAATAPRATAKKRATAKRTTKRATARKRATAKRTTKRATAKRTTKRATAKGTTKRATAKRTTKRATAKKTTARKGTRAVRVSGNNLYAAALVEVSKNAAFATALRGADGVRADKVAAFTAHRVTVPTRNDYDVMHSVHAGIDNCSIGILWN